MRTIFLLTMLLLLAVSVSAQQVMKEDLPEAVREFIYDNEELPFGAPAEDAHEQVKAMENMLGVWECTIHVNYQGKELSGWPAIWSFKYVLGGFAIEDLWYQKQEDFSPALKNLNRDVQGINFRIYDRVEGHWELMWFVNSQTDSSKSPATTRFIAEYKDGEYIMTQPFKEEGPWTRITFSNMNGETFDWLSETSEDGEAWKERLRITGKRIL